MITLDQPWALLLLVPWTLLILAVAARQATTLRWLRPRVSAQGLARLTRYASLPPALHLLGLWTLGALLTLAAAGPYSVAAGELTRSTTDVVLLVDASLSMEANDAHPKPGTTVVPADRLASAKTFALDLMDAMPDARFGLMSFSGDVVTHAPITVDRAAVRTQLRALIGHRIKQSSGSELGRAIGAVVHLWRHREDPLQVVLLSDGDVSSDPAPFDDALTTMRALGVPVHTVAFGSDEGQTRDVLAPGLEPRKLLVKFTTRRDTRTLAKIASGTGGVAVVPETAWVEDLAETIRSRPARARSLQQPVRHDHSRSLIGLALALLLAESALTRRRVAPLLVLLLLGGCTEAQRAAQRLNEEGRIAFAVRRWDDAAAAFEQAAALQVRPHIPLRNLGLTRAAQDRHAEAHSLLERALVVEPSYTDALFDDGVVLYRWGGAELDVEGCRFERTRELWTLAAARFEDVTARGEAERAEANRAAVEAALAKLTEQELTLCGGPQDEPEEGEDKGEPDKGEPDKGDPDKGEPDKGTPDPGEPGKGEPDKGEPDKGDANQGEPGDGAAGGKAGSPPPLTEDERSRLAAELQRARGATEDGASGWRQAREGQQGGTGEGPIRW